MLKADAAEGGALGRRVHLTGCEGQRAKGQEAGAPVGWGVGPAPGLAFLGIFSF